MEIDFLAIRSARARILNSSAPISTLAIQAFSNLSAASSGSRACTSY